jgi:hypothetical protein
LRRRTSAMFGPDYLVLALIAAMLALVLGIALFPE